MRKRSIVTAVGVSVIGAGAASYFLMNEQQKEKVKDKFSEMTNIFNQQSSTFEKAGKPDQIDERDLADLENAKMVSEGSQFGVQYYNDKSESQEIH